MKQIGKGLTAEVLKMKEVDGRTGIVYGYVKGQCIESVFDSGVDFVRNLLDSLF